MKKSIFRGLLAAIMLSNVASAHAAKPAGLVESNLTASVISKGAFSQEFLFVTGSSYDPRAGSIYASGLNSLFSNLGVRVLSASGSNLTGVVSASNASGYLQAKFSDMAFTTFDLAPATTYKLLVSGISAQDGASYGIRGVFVQSISAVPEPETYSMLLAGLCLIGAISLRRVKKD